MVTIAPTWPIVGVPTHTEYAATTYSHLWEAAATTLNCFSSLNNRANRPSYRKNRILQDPTWIGCRLDTTSATPSDVATYKGRQAVGPNARIWDSLALCPTGFALSWWLPRRWHDGVVCGTEPGWSLCKRILNYLIPPNGWKFMQDSTPCHKAQGKMELQYVVSSQEITRIWIPVKN